MNPAGKVRCNMRKQIELGRGDCNFTIKTAHFLLRIQNPLGFGADVSGVYFGVDVSGV